MAQHSHQYIPFVISNANYTKKKNKNNQNIQSQSSNGYYPYYYYQHPSLSTPNFIYSPSPSLSVQSINAQNIQIRDRKTMINTIMNTTAANAQKGINSERPPQLSALLSQKSSIINLESDTLNTSSSNTTVSSTIMNGNGRNGSSSSSSSSTSPIMPIDVIDLTRSNSISMAQSRANSNLSSTSNTNTNSSSTSPIIPHLTTSNNPPTHTLSQQIADKNETNAHTQNGIGRKRRFQEQLSSVNHSHQQLLTQHKRQKLDNLSTKSTVTPQPQTNVFTFNTNPPNTSLNLVNLNSTNNQNNNNNPLSTLQRSLMAGKQQQQQQHSLLNGFSNNQPKKPYDIQLTHLVQYLRTLKANNDQNSAVANNNHSHIQQNNISNLLTQQRNNNGMSNTATTQQTNSLNSIPLQQQQNLQKVLSTILQKGSPNEWSALASMMQNKTPLQQLTNQIRLKQQSNAAAVVSNTNGTNGSNGQIFAIQNQNQNNNVQNMQATLNIMNSLKAINSGNNGIRLHQPLFQSAPVTNIADMQKALAAANRKIPEISLISDDEMPPTQTQKMSKQKVKMKKTKKKKKKKKHKKHPVMSLVSTSTSKSASNSTSVNGNGHNNKEQRSMRRKRKRSPSVNSTLSTTFSQDNDNENNDDSDEDFKAYNVEIDTSTSSIASRRQRRRRMCNIDKEFEEMERRKKRDCAQPISGNAYIVAYAEALHLDEMEVKKDECFPILKAMSRRDLIKYCDYYKLRHSKRSKDNRLLQIVTKHFIVHNREKYQDSSIEDMENMLFWHSVCHKNNKKESRK